MMKRFSKYLMGASINQNWILIVQVLLTRTGQSKCKASSRQCRGLHITWVVHFKSIKYIGFKGQKAN